MKTLRTSCRFWFIVLFCGFVMMPKAHAQISSEARSRSIGDAIATHAVDGEYIKEWLVLGPFFPHTLDTDFLADVGGEANVNPNEGDTVNLTPQPPSLRGKGESDLPSPRRLLSPDLSGRGAGGEVGRTLTWKRYASDRNSIDLLKAIGNHQYATAYAFCLLQSETTDDVQLRLGSDDAVRVWIKTVSVCTATRYIVL